MYCITILCKCVNYHLYTWRRLEWKRNSNKPGTRPRGQLQIESAGTALSILTDAPQTKFARRVLKMTVASKSTVGEEFTSLLGNFLFQNSLTGTCK